MDKFSYISNADPKAIESLYQQYAQDPSSVDEGWKKFFEGFEFAQEAFPMLPGSEKAAKSSTPSGIVSDKEVNVRNLIHAYRTRAHLRSKTNPVRERKDRKPILDLQDFGLSDADLDTEFNCGEEIGIGRAPLRKIIESLKYIYEGTVGFEYMYVRDPEKLKWLREKIEKDALNFKPSKEQRKRILKKLNEAVVFENFLHTKYLGQKRFSLEGGETTIAALDAIINKGAELGVQEVMIGMAHRGRLNVLANIMGKTYEQIFNEFEGNATPDLTMGDGDVKYHMGFSSQVNTPSGNTIEIKLAPNPSHLEAVNPVVEGFVRAKGDAEYSRDRSKVLPVLIHGDAAVAGQGIVYEVVQMSQLDGYKTGGTIHFVINNQVGFTTDFDDARSSIYCTDVAKIIDAPVLHVNGDDPEAVVFCVQFATEYRQKFGDDIFVDMVCYRRHGHNESDEPKFTQPSLYNVISKHPNPREVYNKKLIEMGEVEAELAKTMDAEFRELLQDRLNMVKQKPLPYVYQPLEEEWRNLRRSKPEDFDLSPETGASEAKINKVAEALTKLPKGFKPIKQIEKQLKQRKDMFFKDKQVNWAGGELLAYGTLMLDGKPVRLTGQDVQRGTFSHRHAVLHDANTNEAYNSLNHLEGSEQQFEIYNSLLSEFGVMGFEFGYAMANPNALTIWEAQFGDFANGAQVMIDQFISCSESKWQRMNGLVLLLPHGYEGQGPEHSNARPERYLQLCAEYNMIVANITTPSNFFHALRRQLTWDFRKPLVVMSPKSLLRHPKAISPLEEFSTGRFKEVIGDPEVKAASARKVVLCSGKVYYDLLERREKDKTKDVALIRIEQLHPFPKTQVEELLNQYNKAKEFMWLQEEPENMGYWNYIQRIYPERSFKLISRKASASPATGFAKVHAQEQEQILDKAFA
ncbi:2-oxoglutarate dehydrogenase E1 component [Roseivirga thermotolerans]|uniref:oxoglutarate dehydrogenase (succinyl-transferring) n=1 Tax=Roseivirga thermotolerans TaxID=1758176 RepID=A0ABQ3I5S8_9BACT|nr:2-oxoglutarate dehydrogenase E1 component [Roseivirga thermotolerans]GHE56878.1 2-oxoglutarate dehydrogenase subunit E1 [Roseivirga thermotolerans]